MAEVDRDDLIQAYFHMGFSYNLIVCFLGAVHGHRIHTQYVERRRAIANNVAHARNGCVCRMEVTR